MAKTLYLFSGITPNTQGHPYFNIKNFDNYLTYLINNFTLVKQVNDDNYRINAGIIKLSYTGIETDLITYAIEIEGNKHRCYFIDKVNIQSNMLYLSVSIDYWGTYYLASRISYMHVTRCNRNIGIGIYDEIKYIDTVSSIDAIYPDGRFYNNYEELVLVLQFSYNVQQAIIGDEKISNGCLVFTPLSDFDAPVDFDNSLLLKINAVVNGIYGVTSSKIFVNDAICTKAWILPIDLINEFYDAGSMKVKTKYANLRNEIKTGEFTAYKLIATSEHYVLPIDANINYDYIAGTFRGEGIKLIRFTKDSTNNKLRFGYKSIINGSDLKVYVYQGENEKDVTKAFELDITGKTQEYTGLESIASYVSGVTSVLKSYQKGGLVSAVGNVASQIKFSNCENQIQGTGGAFITYGIINEFIYHKVQKPYVVMAYESTYNEEKNARYNGASFDKFFENINDIFEYDLLGNADYELTYLIVDDITINELPTLPREAIENLFKNGIELFDYEGSTNN